jgi:hypothetical protein
MRHHGQAVRRGLEIDEPETLDAAPEIQARHRKDVRAFVDRRQLVVGQVAEEPHRQVRLARRHRPQLRLVVAFALASDHPVLEPRPEFRRQQLQGLQRLALALARMQTTDRQDHQARLGGGRFRRHSRQVGSQGARRQHHPLRGRREVAAQQLLGVIAQGADPRRAPNQPAGQPAPQRAPGKLEDLRPVEREHQPAGAKAGQKLQQHHRHHGSRLREVDDGASQLPPLAHQLARQHPLATQIMGAPQGQPPQTKRPVVLARRRRCRLGPDLHVVTQRRGSPRDFLGEGRDPASPRVELVGDQVDRRGAGGVGGGAHALGRSRAPAGRAQRQPRAVSKGRKGRQRKRAGGPPTVRPPGRERASPPPKCPIAQALAPRAPRMK